MAKRAIDEYIFADSYIGNFTARLIPRKDLLRIAGSRNLESAEVVLREFGYEENTDLAKGDVDGFLRKEENKLTNQVLGVLPDREELAFQLYPADFRNAAVLLKSEKMGRSLTEDGLSGAGSVAPEKLVQAMRDQNFAFLPAALRDGIREASETYAKGGDPQMIDLVLDRALAQAMLANAEESGEEFLVGVVKKWIDRVNVGTFVRFRELGRSWTSLRDIFLEGGEVPMQTLISSFDEPYARVGEKLEPYGFGKALSEGGKTLKENGSVGLLERMLDDAVMEYVKQVKYESFGVNVIEGYLFAKQSELRNLRIALTGCQLGFAPEEIEERLRETYE